MKPLKKYIVVIEYVAWVPVGFMIALCATLFLHSPLEGGKLTVISLMAAIIIRLIIYDEKTRVDTEYEDINATRFTSDEWRFIAGITIAALCGTALFASTYRFVL